MPQGLDILFHRYLLAQPCLLLLCLQYVGNGNNPNVFNQWMNNANVVYIYSKEYYSVVKKIMSFSGKWRERIILNEVTLAQKRT